MPKPTKPTATKAAKKSAPAKASAPTAVAPAALSAPPAGIHVVPAKLLDELIQHGLKSPAGNALWRGFALGTPGVDESVMHDVRIAHDGLAIPANHPLVRAAQQKMSRQQRRASARKAN